MQQTSSFVVLQNARHQERERERRERISLLLLLSRFSSPAFFSLRAQLRQYAAIQWKCYFDWRIRPKLQPIIGNSRRKKKFIRVTAWMNVELSLVGFYLIVCSKTWSSHRSVETNRKWKDEIVNKTVMMTKKKKKMIEINLKTFPQQLSTSAMNWIWKFLRRKANNINTVMELKTAWKQKEREEKKTTTVSEMIGYLDLSIIRIKERSALKRQNMLIRLKYE